MKEPFPAGMPPELLKKLRDRYFVKRPPPEPRPPRVIKKQPAPREDLMNDELCPFCAVAERGAGAFVVYEDAHAVVFMDKHPINEGHVLAVPRRHAAAFYELDEEAFVGLMLAVKRMAAVLEAVYRPKKVGMLAAGFDVAHAHVHVLPMHDYHDITSRAALEGARADPPEAELREAAGRIRRGLGARGAA